MYSSWIVTDSPAIADVGATHQLTRLEVLSRGLFEDKPQTRGLSTRLSSVANTLLSVQLLDLGSSSETQKQPSQLSRRVWREHYDAVRSSMTHSGMVSYRTCGLILAPGLG